MKYIFSLSAFLLLFIYTQAQTLERVNDLQPNGAGSYPKTFITCNGKLFFTADVSPYGREMWCYDGDTAMLMVDAWSGWGDGNPENVTVVDNKVFFTARTGEYTRERLFVSDGTPGGSHLVKDMLASTSSIGHNIIEMAGYKGKLYFSGDDSITHPELWVSDGTEAGTKLLKKINPEAGYGSYPGNFIVYKDKLYFTASGGHGNELWVTDGTANGTYEFKDIFNSFSASSDPSNFIVFKDQLFFTADDGTHGHEIWVSDGTPNGTHMLKDINPAGSQPLSLVYYQYVVSNNQLYFTAVDSHGYELWVTDGTANGTHLVKDICTAIGGHIPGPQPLCMLRDKFFFVANDSIHGSEPYVTDGTANGTHMLRDVCPGTCGTPVTVAGYYNGKVYFSMSDSVGYRLYVTDGTTDSTYSLETTASVSYANTTGYTYDFCVFNGALYFTGDFDNEGDELWRITAPNTGIKQVNTGNTALLNLYPNPASQYTMVQWKAQPDARITVEVMNMLGQTMQLPTPARQETTTGYMKMKINTQDFAPGLYLVKVTQVNPLGLRTVSHGKMEILRY